jgi:uncharacterized protein (DUF1501 family)
MGLAAGAASLAGSQSSLAAPASSNQALVCIYLFGGNDSNNLVVPLDAARYTAYAQGRGELAIANSALLPITAAKSGARFGLHPALVELQGLHDRRVLAIVANVGSLVEPVTKSAYLAGTAKLPADLMKHQYTSLGFLKGGFTSPRWSSGVWYTFNTGLSLISQKGVSGPAHENALLLQNIGSASLRTLFPSTALGSQLRQAAALIRSGAKLGMGNQTILCSLSGFDLHGPQADRQNSLFRQLSQAMAAFYEATVELGVSQWVTAYTDSEFNRALRPNSSRGTEHGWGGHQLVLGGAVLGGDVYGSFPDLTLGGAQDVTGNGVMIPTTARDQYLATLARWAGMKNADLNYSFPSLRAFGSQTLAFL